MGCVIHLASLDFVDALVYNFNSMKRSHIPEQKLGISIGLLVFPVFFLVFFGAFNSSAYADLVSQLKDSATVDAAAKSLCENPEISMHSNGGVDLVRCTENGVPEGKSFSFYPDGTTKAVGSHHQGELEGEWTRYYPDGKMRDRGEWSKGKPDGNWEFWNEDGSLHRTDQYDKGTVLPKVVHFLDIAVLVGLNYTYTPNQTNYSGCYAAGGPNQPCFGTNSISNKGGVGFGSGVLLDYHLWRRWIIELGVFYRSIQTSKSAQFSDQASPPDIVSSTQSYAEQMIAFPAMWRFMIGEHFSLGAGIEMRVVFPMTYSTVVTPVAGNVNLTGASFSNYNYSRTNWLSAIGGVAYRTQLSDKFGLVVDVRASMEDIQFLAGISYRLLPSPTKVSH